MDDPKYPEIDVQLTGEDANSFRIIGSVLRALKDDGVSESERNEFMEEAQSGNYDHILQICMKWVNVS